MRSKYIDLNDIDNPIKTYIVSEMEFSFEPKSLSKTDIFIERNEVTLQDSWIFNLLESKPTHFNSFGKSKIRKTDYPFDVGIYGTFIFKLSDKTNQYRRKIGNLFEVAGILGGIFEV